MAYSNRNRMYAINKDISMALFKLATAAGDVEFAATSAEEYLDADSETFRSEDEAADYLHKIDAATKKIEDMYKDLFDEV